MENYSFFTIFTLSSTLFGAFLCSISALGLFLVSVIPVVPLINHLFMED